jgi:hypothetical protein
VDGHVKIVADGRIFSLGAGDWTMLVGSFGLAVLALWML